MGPWGLDQGYVEGFAAVMFCGHVGPLGCFFSALFDLAGGFLRTVRKLKRHKSMKMRSDKCKKGGFDSFFVVFVAYESLLQWAVKFGACLHQSSAILVHSWGISFSMLARFAQCWGSVGASRGGMLEVIGAVGSMLKALLLLFYFFAAMFVHLAVFFAV